MSEVRDKVTLQKYCFRGTTRRPFWYGIVVSYGEECDNRKDDDDGRGVPPQDAHPAHPGLVEVRGVRGCGGREGIHDINEEGRHQKKKISRCTNGVKLVAKNPEFYLSQRVE